MNMKFLKVTIVTLGTLALIPLAHAEKGIKGLGVGSGLAFAAANQALFTNPTSLLDAEPLSLEGLYLFDPENIHTSIVGAKGDIGLGLGWRQSGSANIFEGGFGYSLGAPKMGLTLRSVDGNGLDGDFAFTLDFSKLRLSTIARGIDSGVDRFDVGLGFQIGSNAVFEFDAKKPLPLDSDSYFFDVGLALVSGPISLGAGYDFGYVANTFIDGGLHAGFSWMALPKLYIEAFYRPMAQEWGAGEWAAGARYTF